MGQMKIDDHVVSIEGGLVKNSCVSNWLKEALLVYLEDQRVEDLHDEHKEHWG